jgi:hypothetical protein
MSVYLLTRFDFLLATALALITCNQFALLAVEPGVLDRFPFMKAVLAQALFGFLRIRFLEGDHVAHGNTLGCLKTGTEYSIFFLSVSIRGTFSGAQYFVARFDLGASVQDPP